MWVVRMSNTLPNSEDTRKQVKVRAGSQLVERFDQHVEQSDEYSSRAEAIRAAMNRMLGSADQNAPRTPPTDNDKLREGYLTLVAIANHDGVIPHELAVAELSTALGKSREVIEQTIIKKLRDRGYIGQRTNFTTSERSWKLRGVDDER